MDWTTDKSKLVYKYRFSGIALSATVLLAILLAFFTFEIWPDPYNTTCKPPAQQHSDLATKWKWDYQRDKRSFSLTQAQCNVAFPDLFKAIDQSVVQRAGKPITKDELYAVESLPSDLRVMIFNQQIYVLEANATDFSRGQAVLHALSRAVTSSLEPLPNIEVTITVTDWEPPAVRWSFARKPKDKQTWLMPDFGFWSWPETKVGSYGEVMDKALEMETSTSNPSGKAWSWDDKIQKVLWRGAVMNKKWRKALINATEGKPWADVKALRWKNKESTATDLKSMAEHCQYKYLVNTAGNSYSGRLKNIQNCRSVILMHKDNWITHYNHLMKKNGPDQNFVEVERDFTDLEGKIKKLLADDKKAKKIADNSVNMFRERYITPAAEACYWRQLIRSWAAISFEPEFYKIDEDGKKVWRGLPVESFMLMGELDWDPY